MSTRISDGKPVEYLLRGAISEESLKAAILYAANLDEANERIKDLTDLLTNLEEILESGNSIKPTSIIRSAMQIAIGKTNAGSISNQ